MKKKIVAIICLMVFVSAGFIFVKNHNQKNKALKVSSEKLNPEYEEISNMIMLHINSDDKYESETIKDIHVEYDDVLKLYVAKIYFEDKEKPSVLFINSDTLIQTSKSH